jgi:YBL028C ribosome biogenesis factor, N-terminal domain
MAKSTRSKAKRSFRRDKREREDSVFFINDAARLARLSSKLRSKFADGAVEGNDAEAGPAGWYAFVLFGLIDPYALVLDA